MDNLNRFRTPDPIEFSLKPEHSLHLSFKFAHGRTTMPRKGMIGRVSAVRSKTMASIRTRHTRPELILRKHLSALGLRYRLHTKNLPGRPDIVFPRAKIAIFCDGDFWHGRNWKQRVAAGQFKVRKSYWTEKIRSNIARDKRNNRDLRKMGWIALRFWATDIEKNAKTPAILLRKFVRERSRKPGKPRRAP